MSADSANNDQPTDAGPASPPDAGRPGQADPWGIAWASDALRSARSIGPLSSLASLGPRLRSRRPVVIAGIAVVGLLGGAGAALATTGSGTPALASRAVAATPTPTPTASPGGLPGRMHGRGFAGFGFGGGAGLFGAVHGQFVTAKPGGGYQTVDVQNGEVTAISATSITLRSSDGYSHTYTIASSTLVDAQRDGIGSVKVGNQASVSATVSGATATAVSIADLTLLQQGRQAFGYPGHGRVNWSGPPVASGSSPGSSG
jgi:hypothetical protein